MKNTYKAALLAVLGLSVVSAAQAQTSDLMLGLTDLAGPTSAQNDYTIDLGSFANFNTSYSQTWSIDSGMFSTAFGTDSSALNDVSAGAVGASGTSASPKEFFETGLTTPANISSTQRFNDTQSDASAVLAGVVASASGTWSANVAQDFETPGINGSPSIAGVTANPMFQLTGGVVTENVYEALGTTRSYTDIGTLTIDANADTVTFTGTAVPEPSSYALIAAAGLLLAGLRRQFVSKNA